MIALLFMGLSFFRNPSVFNTMRDVKEVRDCKKNLTSIHESLKRYRQMNDKYPAKLVDLWPNYLESKEILHCPLDPNSGEISYEYNPPSADAPPQTIVITCRWHMFTEKKSPIILRLLKDGTIKSKQVPPDSR